MFSALLTKCVEKEVIAVCRYTARKNVSPYFVALVPQEEELDEQNIQVTPGGMWQRHQGSLRGPEVPESPSINPAWEMCFEGFVGGRDAPLGKATKMVLW